jgi:RNA polymerase sigma-70 factor (ECF subfamily)
MAAGVEGEDADRARRFRDAALPHLDDVHTLARYLLRSAADADDAVQECYLRAFQHFDGWRGQATGTPLVRPWLMAILRNVCRGEFARRSAAAGDVADVAEDALPLWQEPGTSPETAILRQREAEAVAALLAALP